VLYRQLINDMTWYPYLHLLFSFISPKLLALSYFSYCVYFS